MNLIDKKSRLSQEIVVETSFFYDSYRQAASIIHTWLLKLIHFDYYT